MVLSATVACVCLSFSGVIGEVSPNQANARATPWIIVAGDPNLNLRHSSNPEKPKYALNQRLHGFHEGVP